MKKTCQSHWILYRVAQGIVVDDGGNGGGKKFKILLVLITNRLSLWDYM